MSNALLFLEIKLELQESNQLYIINLIFLHSNAEKLKIDKQYMYILVCTYLGVQYISIENILCIKLYTLYLCTVYMYSTIYSNITIIQYTYTCNLICRTLKTATKPLLLCTVTQISS